MKKAQNKNTIKVIGIGGAGGNAVTRMFKDKIRQVQLAAINTDLQDLQKAQAHFKVAIGRKVTGGLGTGMNPALGRKAAKEDQEKITRLIEGSQMVFIAAGFGGGTGSGAAPVVAELSRGKGILTVAVATLPFAFEGRARSQVARRAAKELARKSDAFITIDNNRLLTLHNGDLAVKAAFAAGDEMLRQAVQAITDLITLPGIINVDFADVRTILKDAGTALFGVGVGKGERRAEQAVRLALAKASQLTGLSPKGAKGVLFTLAGRDMSLAEVEETAKFITRETRQGARVIFGAIQDESLRPGQVKITVIATGF